MTDIKFPQMDIETMKASATNFGFDPIIVAQILAKYGPAVLAIALEAARNGMSVNLIVEILTKFGPQALEFLISLWNHQNRLGVDVIDGPVITGDNVTPDSSFIDVVVQQYLPIILQKYLPIIINKYGPQILQAVVAAIMQYLQTLQPQPQSK